MRTLAHPTALARAPLHAQQLTDALRKRLETCRARCALEFGIALESIEADDGSLEFVASVHALCRRFRTVREVEQWLVALDALDAPRLEVGRFIGATQESLS